MGIVDLKMGIVPALLWIVETCGSAVRPKLVNDPTSLSLTRRCDSAVRFLHVTDSQVVLAVMAKGRSSSKQLNWLLRRVAALNLVADVTPSYVFVSSADNPADAPSRWWDIPK